MLEDVKKKVLLESLVMMRALYGSWLTVRHMTEQERALARQKVASLDSLIATARRINGLPAGPAPSSADTASRQRDHSVPALHVFNGGEVGE